MQALGSFWLFYLEQEGSRGQEPLTWKWQKFPKKFSLETPYKENNKERMQKDVDSEEQHRDEISDLSIEYNSKGTFDGMMRYCKAKNIFLINNVCN